MIIPKIMLHTAVAACLASMAGLATADDEGIVRIPGRSKTQGTGAGTIRQTAFLSADKCAENASGGPCAEGGHGGPCGEGAKGGTCGDGGGPCAEAGAGGPCGEGQDPNACAESGHGNGHSQNGLFGGKGLLGGSLFGGGKSKGSHSGSGNSSASRNGNGSRKNGSGSGHAAGHGAGQGHGSNAGNGHGLAHGNGNGNGSGNGSDHGNGRIYRPVHPNDANHGGFGNGGRLFGQHGSGNYHSSSGWNSGPYGGPAHTGNELCNCLFGWAIPSGNCGQGLPLFGKYHTVYADNPGYVNPADTQLYATGANGLPVVIPTAPNVNYQYNYSSGMPASRITTLGTWNPQTAPQRMKFQTW